MKKGGCLRTRCWECYVVPEKRTNACSKVCHGRILGSKNSHKNWIQHCLLAPNTSVSQDSVFEAVFTEWVCLWSKRCVIFSEEHWHWDKGKRCKNFKRWLFVGDIKPGLSCELTSEDLQSKTWWSDCPMWFKTKQQVLPYPLYDLWKGSRRSQKNWWCRQNNTYSNCIVQCCWVYGLSVCSPNRLWGVSYLLYDRVMICLCSADQN